MWSATDSPGSWFWWWKWNRCTIATGFESKYCLSTATSCTKDLSLGDSDDMRFRNSLAANHRNRTAICFSYFMSLASKNIFAYSTYSVILSLSGSNFDRCPKVGILTVALRCTPLTSSTSHLRHQTVVYPAYLSVLRCSRIHVMYRQYDYLVAQGEGKIYLNVDNLLK